MLVRTALRHGSLAVEEAKEAHSANQAEKARTEMRYLAIDFMEADIDGHGYLTYSEFCGLILGASHDEHSEAELREAFEDTIKTSWGECDGMCSMGEFAMRALQLSRLRVGAALDRMFDFSGWGEEL